MERMEVDQCAGAGGGALRRSNSAPMIASVGFVVLHSYVFKNKAFLNYMNWSILLGLHQLPFLISMGWEKTGLKGLEIFFVNLS